MILYGKRGGISPRHQKGSGKIMQLGPLVTFDRRKYRGMDAVAWAKPAEARALTRCGTRLLCAVTLGYHMLYFQATIRCTFRLSHAELSGTHYAIARGFRTLFLQAVIRYAMATGHRALYFPVGL
jgi:hypothetical protein